MASPRIGSTPSSEEEDSPTREGILQRMEQIKRL
jgi:hypothetical protein